MPAKRVVLDSNVLLSRILFPGSVPARAVKWSSKNAAILISGRLAAEMLDVLSRPKFARFVDIEDARAFIHALAGIAEHVELTAHVEACRDPGDDHILALALSGSADCIVTGDSDLLVMNPFQGVPILSPAEFLEIVAGGAV
jgi:putative PIN family toxin of toxin-antitoxin system